MHDLVATTKADIAAALPTGQVSDELSPPGLSQTIGDEQVVRDLAHDPVRLASCRQLRGAQVAIVLLLLRDVFGTEPGWDDGIHWALEPVGP